MRELPDLMLSYGIKLKERGNRFECLCPAHDDHNPSMSVFRNGDGEWKAHCFSCGFHENNYGFVGHMEGLDTRVPEEFLKIKEFIGDPTHKAAPYATIEAEKLPTRPQRETYPPPADAPDPPWTKANYQNEAGEWVSMGEPVSTWTFTTLDGAPWYYECRYEVTNADGEIRKEPRCWSWGHRSPMPPRWECAAPSKPRPLYGLEMLKQAKQILITEGPKKASAAQSLLPNSVACLTWSNGANGAKHADWSILSGYTSLSAILCPDADEPGYQAMDWVGRKLAELGFADISIVGLEDMPEGWDIADGIKEGWTAAQLIGFFKERKREWEQTPEPEPVVSESLMTEPPAEPLPPPDVYKEVGIRWTEPQDLFHEFQAPRISPEMLPEPIAEWAYDAAQIIGCDPALLAMPAIVSCASVLHDDIQIQPKALDTRWRESARLWLAIVGDSSTKKSVALIHANAPIKKIDAECNENEGKLRYRFKLEEAAHSKREAEYIKKLSDGDKTAEIPQKPEMPEIPRAIAQDCTIEAVRDILKHSSRGILAERDELAGWFGSHDQYKNAKGSDRAAWLEAYNGGARRIDRVGTGGIFVRNWSISLVGAIQPDRMAEITNGMTDDGLLQRFMVCYGRSGNEGLDAEHNRAAHDRYHAIVRQIWDTVPSADVVTLSEGAQEVRNRITQAAYKLIETKFLSSGFCSAVGKYTGLSARLMLTYHTIECAAKHVHPQSCQVSEETAQRVELLMNKFLLQHAIIFYMQAGNAGNMAKKVRSVAGLILAHGLDSITKRYIHHHNDQWRRWKEPERETILRQLIDAGWIVPAEGRRGIDKFPTNFLVNPALPVMFDKHKLAEIERREQWAAIYRDMRDDN